LLAPRPTPKLEDHPSSAVRGCLFNLFSATLHVGGRFSPFSRLLFIYCLLFITAKRAFITVKFTRTFHAFPNRFTWPVYALVHQPVTCSTEACVGPTIDLENPWFYRIFRPWPGHCAYWAASGQQYWRRK